MAFFTTIVPKPGTEQKLDKHLLLKKPSLLLWELKHMPVLFFFCHVCGTWKFPGQGSNLRHSSDSSYCSNNTGSLTCCTTRELLKMLLLIPCFPSWFFSRASCSLVPFFLNHMISLPGNTLWFAEWTVDNNDLKLATWPHLESFFFFF